MRYVTRHELCKVELSGDRKMLDDGRNSKSSSVPAPTKDSPDRSSLMSIVPILAEMAAFTVGYQPLASAQ